MVNKDLMTDVELSRVQKYLDALPEHILEKLSTWVRSVERFGIRQTRKRRGWHDEPLKGVRQGQRSIRLNKAYRAIYQEMKIEQKTIIFLLEISKHKY